MPLRVLVTGASRGFGAALSLAFAERGAKVFAGARSARSELERIARRYPAEVVPLELDVRRLEQIERARDQVLEQTDALDVLVNNAAIRSATADKPLEDIDFDDAALTFDVNALGALRVSRAFLPLLRRGEASVLVNVSSEAGSIGRAGREREFDYCMSKAALNMATKLLANYLPTMRVFSLHPGWLRTDMGGAHAALDPLEVAREVAALIERERTNQCGSLFLDHAGNSLAW